MCKLQYLKNSRFQGVDAMNDELKAWAEKAQHQRAIHNFNTLANQMVCQRLQPGLLERLWHRHAGPYPGNRHGG